MPFPKIKKGEKKNDFVSKCIQNMSHKDPTRKHEQIVAICEQNSSIQKKLIEKLSK